jgi:phage terminase small subunit
MLTLRRLRHPRFVDEIAKDCNATAAYKRAGYTARGHSAAVNASRLRKRPDVAIAIKQVTVPIRNLVPCLPPDDSTGRESH